MQGESAVLITERGFDRLRHFPLNGDVITIGRWPDNDIVLPHRLVSHHHARIYRYGHFYFIEDLQSTAGTYINGERLSAKRPLSDGDRIRIPPHFEFSFSLVQLSDEEAARSHSGLRIDHEHHTVYVGDTRVDPPLSQAQYTLLELLVRHAGKVVPREEIVTAIWPASEAANVTDQAIDALVRRLRERLAEVDPDHQYIVTVRGHGFRFENR